MPSATVNGATLSYQWDGTETKPVPFSLTL